MILFCLDNLNVDPFLVGFGFDLVAFFAIKINSCAKLQIYDEL